MAVVTAAARQRDGRRGQARLGTTWTHLEALSMCDSESVSFPKVDVRERRWQRQPCRGWVSTAHHRAASAGSAPDRRAACRQERGAWRVRVRVCQSTCVRSEHGKGKRGCTQL